MLIDTQGDVVMAAAKIAAYTDGSTEIMQDRIAAGMVKTYA
ncbi:MAG: hypothetical protein WA138_08455 [Parvibaculum sp.]